MLNATDETLSGAVTRWLAEFERALGASDEASLEALFRPDAHWRDRRKAAALPRADRVTE